MVTYTSSLKGLKIIIKPTKVSVDNGFPKKEIGESIEFVNGFYYTKDDNKIKFLDNYISANPGIISKIESITPTEQANPYKVNSKASKKNDTSKTAE